MELVQSRIITDDVERLAAFYARLIGVPTALNEYYVEVQAGRMSVGFSKRRFTEDHRRCPAVANGGARDGTQDRRPEIILDFLVRDADAEGLDPLVFGVEWVMPPATQPWGNRSMIFRDPEGNLINVFSRPERQK
jgi:predicted enzyme related to lactoylglutathione lyase